MKKMIVTMAMMLMALSAKAADAQNLTYGIHLFFNETEFLDVMVLDKNASGKIEGTMFVPNDFDGKLENIKMTETTISFDLFVPKNAARPEDLIFHYEGQFFDSTKEQLTGYVTIQNQSGFVASFVGFLRKP
jgi:hypothetical protein